MGGMMRQRECTRRCRRKKKVGMVVVSLAMLWMVGGGTGCASLKGAGDPPQVAEAGLALAGQVIRVNTADGYVVVESISLPSPGDLAMVMRDGARVGLVRFTGATLGQYALADIVEGQPLRGDWLRREAGVREFRQGER